MELVKNLWKHFFAEIKLEMSENKYDYDKLRIFIHAMRLELDKIIKENN